MAGDWMKIELELADKPEVHYIASLTKLDPDAVIGKLIRVWAWFDKHTTDGNAQGVTFALIDRMVSHVGFGEAMQFAGWLNQRGTVLSIPKFVRHNGESAKKRALTTERVQRHRNAASVTKTFPEKRREEKRKGIDASGISDVSTRVEKGQTLLLKKTPKPQSSQDAEAHGREAALKALAIGRGGVGQS